MHRHVRTATCHMAFGRVDETDGHLVRKARAECCHVSTFESPVPPIQWRRANRRVGGSSWHCKATVCSASSDRARLPTCLAHIFSLAGPFPALPNERPAWTLYPFEFPRPFDTFDTPSFLTPLCSEMLSNTLFGIEGTAFDTFDTLAVLRKTLRNTNRMAFFGLPMTF